MMAEKSRKNVVRLKLVDEDQIPPLLERRAAKVLDLLCGTVSSPAAKSNGLSENEIINAIKKLKPSLGEPGYGYLYTPVWNISSEQELKQVGLDLEEIDALASILPFGESSHKTNVSDQLIPEILFTLNVLDYEEDKFRQFTRRLIYRYPAVGVLLCEILTDTKLLEKARHFLDRESTDLKREIFFENLKATLLYITSQNFNIAHFASLCGQYIATIVPKEINHIHINKDAESDVTALATVISHSSVVKKLILFGSGRNSISIASLQGGLKNSDVKIRSLDIFNNHIIDEEGFRCLGNIVKKHAVEEFTMDNCRLSFGKLQSFNHTSGNAKIRSFRVSDDIDEEGFHCLGNIVKKHAVEELDMSWCGGLSIKKLKSFHKTSGNAKIRSLNISHNEGMDEEGFRCLGNIVKKHEVEELDMSWCGLSFGKLMSLDNASGNAKIRSLIISWNKNIDEEGFRCLGNIVKKHAVEELDMSSCGLSIKKLKSFDDASGNTKIKVLDISNNEGLIVNTICQLTLKVTESLSAKRSSPGVWSEQDIGEMQDFIHAHHPGGLKVTLGDGLPELRSEDKASFRMSETVIVEEDSHSDGDSPLSSPDSHDSTANYRCLTEARDETWIVAHVAPLKKHSAVKEASTPISVHHHHYHHEHITNISNSTIGKISVDDGSRGSGESENQKPSEEDIEAQRDGWVKISGNIFMYNETPLHSGTQVYRAELRHASGKTKEAVVKLLPKDEKHKKEIDILLELDDHPNIVKILYSGEFPGLIPQLYVVMERCHQNLKQYIKGKKSCQLSILVPKAKSFFKQMISAIVFIHGRNIIHRDLKPSNILISSDEESLKVADFGISREIPEDRTQVTVSNSEAGTDGYKPPEAHQGTRIGYKADVFQMGINGYYIATTGQHPFGEDCNIQAVNIKNNKAPDFREVHQLPGPLTCLLKGMLQHSPADRPTAEKALSDDFFNTL